MELLPVGVELAPVTLFRPERKYQIAPPARTSSRTIQSQPMLPLELAAEPVVGAAVWAKADDAPKKTEQNAR
jgi:hypothetical protein